MSRSLKSQDKNKVCVGGGGGEVLWAVPKLTVTFLTLAHETPLSTYHLQNFSNISALATNTTDSDVPLKCPEATLRSDTDNTRTF